MARHWRSSVVITAAVIASAAGWVQPAFAACGGWQKVAGAPVRGQFLDVSASSATNVWAVGIRGQSYTLVERWNGSIWRRIASPNPGRLTNTLAAVAAIAPDDVWAVGSFGSAHPAALVVHWDGSAWHRARLPSTARHANLADVAAISANDVWAVGVSADFSKTRALHYNGKTWKVIPSISASAGGFSGVAATSSTDVWAVGNVLIEHWDGHAWSRMGSPGAGHHRRLSAVAAISSTDALALDLGRGAIDRWDGSSWTTAATATAGTHTGLLGIAASGPTDAWAVGVSGSSHPAVDHWDGVALAEGVISGQFSGLLSVANVPATTSYWAVGNTFHTGALGNFYATPLIERCG